MTDRTGNDFEIACMKYLRGVGGERPAQDITRLPKAGSLDEGDLAVCGASSLLFIVEAKARRSKTNQLTLGSYMAEAVREAEQYARARGAPAQDAIPTVFLKRPGKSIGDCFAVLRLQDFARL